jgi:hypothetical protein
MPSVFDEDINFVPQLGPKKVCLSAYQTSLNKIYQIASPILENLYGIRHPQDVRQRIELSNMIAEVDQALQKWRHKLPLFLAYDRINDISTSSTPECKAHSLQALSLQLTYDNLVMVFNQPLLADQLSYPLPSMAFTPPGWTQIAKEQLPDTQTMVERKRNAFRRCLDSALSISRVQSKKSLVELARQTHLVSFLGINLFTASVVMFICARSDILSNIAQEAKRGMARILQLQKVLSTQTSLSMQCSVILEDLVQLVLEKEKEAMLSSSSNDRTLAPSSHHEIRNINSCGSSNGINALPLAHPMAADSGAVENSALEREIIDSSYENDHFRESLMSLQRGIRCFHLAV